MKLNDVLYDPEVVRYAKRSMEDPLQLAQIFPEETKGSLDLKMFKGGNQLPVTAHVHAFDSETELASLDRAQYDIATMLLIKRKYRIGEELCIRLAQTSDDAIKADIKREIYTFVDNLVNSIKVRFEAMRAEVLQTGKVTIKENDVKLTIDYHMPKDNLTTADWSTDDSNPLKDISGWMDKIYDASGVMPTRALTRRKTLVAILNNPVVRKQVLGSNADRLLSQSELNLFNTQHDLPAIATYEGRYQEELPSGKREIKKYINDDSFILLPPGTVGNTFYGPTAEALELRQDPSYQVSESDKITISTARAFDAPTKEIKASATGLITAPYIDEVLCAKVTIPE